jgi:sugar/nucleoside kinase (ribokinase family)
MKKKAIFCGLTTVDIQYFVDSFPASNQKIKTVPPIIEVGGPAANAAITYSFLGGNGLLITGIGINHFSTFITSDFENHRVEIADMATGKEFSPIIASIVTNQNNSERAIISHLPPPLLVNENQISTVDFSGSDMVLIDGFYPEVALQVCEKAKENNIPVVFDGGSWKSNTNNLLCFVDIALCSEDFLPPGCKNSSDVIEYLESNGIRKIAITRGEKDIIISQNGVRKNIPVKPIEAIDSLGAGDVFHGAFAWFYPENCCFEKTIERAAITASFSTMFKGTRNWMRKFCNLSE